MKSLLTMLIVFTGLLVAMIGCTKHINGPQPYEKGWWRVAAIGHDTTYSKDIYARAESGPTSDYPHASVDEDAYLKAELVAYTGGKYMVIVTNKQNADANIQWHWDGVDITDVSPASLTVPANSFKVYYLTGNAKFGKIKVITTTVVQDLGAAPKWLMLDIAASILPITYYSCDVNHNNNTGWTTATFSIDNPQDVDKFEVQFLNEQKIWTVKAIGWSDGKTKNYSIKF